MRPTYRPPPGGIFHLRRTTVRRLQGTSALIVEILLPLSEWVGTATTADARWRPSPSMPSVMPHVSRASNCCRMIGSGVPRTKSGESWRTSALGGTWHSCRSWSTCNAGETCSPLSDESSFLPQTRRRWQKMRFRWPLEGPRRASTQRSVGQALRRPSHPPACSRWANAMARRATGFDRPSPRAPVTSKRACTWGA